ncbi:2-oxoacid ferredoxin oxidoreductase [candidate division WWE3 bacterium CG10_big_fil_rev_8_21_14_0_10_32_10]|uniref:2-oxoacid ferredoxin oxidoreductase n=1 Tax=candidate division WWE3 bacterium CG10_big_fil_rev_8_21_14_0_10_32_10 TaxID=1975090 RepID=A0A2H0RA86_UNCKA|nr:MAG: 2-oxoacid ferredoxin oxidoreductase [candidate division WWE3 bacterium CG10_big_fil_rev_8_21_14_0_10_32_10]
MTQLIDLNTTCSPNWCQGCGNLPLWAAFKNACVEKTWDNTNTAIVAGIGCHGHIINFTKLTSFEGLHGRPIPVATGVKLANSRLNVFVFTGDGDCLGEGGNHFLHGCRRNHDITIILHDNGIYALTTGQTSPASPNGYKSKSTPDGNIDNPLNPLAIAITAGATFVAREYASNIKSLTELMIKANEHKGFSVVDVLQPCVTFNKEYTHEFFQQNSYYLDESHDKTNKEMAFKKSLEFGIKQIPLGIFYEVETPSYESQVIQIKDKSLIEISTENRNTNELFKRYI